MRIPDRLGWIRARSRGPGWLEALPSLVAACAERWDLQLGEPFEDSFVSWVAPVATPDGPAVLKVQYPHGEAEFEADALAAWEGDGAVRLLAHDRERGALLLERCTPGQHLSTIGPDAAIGVLVELLPRLWVEAATPFRSVVDEARDWVDALPQRWERAGRPFPRLLVDAAVDHLEALIADVDASVLVHQDLHGDNVLAAQREPWLAIDPKPLLADREFSLSPIIRSGEFGHSKALVVGRLDRLTDELGLDRDRARRWCFGQTVAWSIEGTAALDGHVDVARWLLGA